MSFLLLATLLVPLAETQPGGSGEVDWLVKRLGSVHFAEREAASKALEAIGKPALPALRAAVKSDDAEVRRRAGYLVLVIVGRPAWLVRRLGGSIEVCGGTEASPEVAVDVWNSAIFDGELVALPSLGTITFLNLSETGVTDAGMAHLQRMPRMQHLFLAWTRISDSGLTHLVGLTDLPTLDLTGCQVTDAGVAQLRGLRHLRRLKLRATNVTEAAIAELTKQLPGLDIRR